MKERAFLSLSPDQLHAEKMEACRAAYEGGNVVVLLEVVYWCRKGKRELPEWAVQPVMDWLSYGMGNENPRPKKKGRAGSPWQRYKQDMSDYAIWDVERDARDAKAGNHAVEATAIALSGTKISRSAETIPSVVKRVSRIRKTEPWRYFQMSAVRLDEGSSSREVHQVDRLQQIFKD